MSIPGNFEPPFRRGSTTVPFNVTMQNHGGYDGIGELKPEEIVDVDEEYSGYSDLQM